MACATAGLQTVVMLGNAIESVDADVLSLDADTRALESHRAAGETSLLMRRHMSRHEQIVFKKVDSTLRGNVGAELAAVLTAQRGAFPQGGRVVAVLAPAFPANGRATREGKQLLFGKPLEETEIWQRESKQGTSYIPEILEAAGLRSAVVALNAARSNGNWHGIMKKLAEEIDVLVCDAETDQDLQCIATGAAALGRQTVWAGSAGLAYHLPRAFALTSTSRTTLDEELASGPTLFVVGSFAAVSREQARLLTASPEIVAVTIPSGDLLAGVQSPAGLQLGLCLAEAFAAKRDVVVSLGTEGDSKNLGRALSSALAQLLAPYSAKVGAVVLTGGETARLVLQTWGVTAMRLVKELEPGLPFSITENWGRRLPVITKAGDFGNLQTLLHCHQFFRDLDRRAIKRPM